MRLNLARGTEQDLPLRHDEKGTYVPDIGTVEDGITVVGIEIIRNYHSAGRVGRRVSVFRDYVTLHGIDIAGRRRSCQLAGEWKDSSPSWKEGFFFDGGYKRTQTEPLPAAVNI